MTAWQTVELEQVARIDRSSIKPEAIEPGTAYLGLEHIEHGGEITDSQTVQNGELKSSKFRFSPEHLLYGKLRPYLAKIAAPDFDGICSTDIIPLLPGADIDKRYLLHFLRQKRMVDYATSRASGANLPRLSPKELAKFKIPLPPLAEQKRIATILDAADALRAKRRETLAQLDTLLQSTFLEMFGDPVTNPKGWKKTPMGQLMRIRRGGSPRPIKRYLGGTINWVKIGDATRSDDDLYIRSCAEKISEDGLSKTTLLQPGSLIFANSGVSLGFARILSVQGAIHDGWLAFEGFDEDLLDRIFFLKALNGITEHFRKTAPSGTQPNLNTSIMKAFQIILPPIGDQRHFAAIVQSVEQQKSRLRAHLDELDALFGSLQTRAFAGEL